MNRLLPGKREAAILLVANERTRAALPQGIAGEVITLVENGVDLALWTVARDALPKLPGENTRYVFLGRLVDWKAVDLLLQAFKQAAARSPMTLSIIGDDRDDGDDRASLEKLAQQLEIFDGAHDGVAGKVFFHGWMSQVDCARQLRQCDALVLPSLMECGGAVVLEAMAMEIPVIATAWGGPADYLDDSCGILVEPASRQGFVDNLESALVRMSASPQQRVAMGKAGRDKVIREFDWEVKVDRMLQIYAGAIAAARSNQ
jgi:glycosyltransferase involved in cell wall biosynthesis